MLSLTLVEQRSFVVYDLERHTLVAVDILFFLETATISETCFTWSLQYQHIYLYLFVIWNVPIEMEHSLLISLGLHDKY